MAALEVPGGGEYGRCRPAERPHALGLGKGLGWGRAEVEVPGWGWRRAEVEVPGLG